MNAKEIALVNFINREGYDNSKWGVEVLNGATRTLREMFGSPDPDWYFDRVVPDKYIWIWVDSVEAERIIVKLKDQAYPDMICCPRPKETVLLWSIS